jgi:hypothetical protein
MPARQSSAVDRALRRIQRGATAYAAAKAEGIALSTIYRAMRRLREAERMEYVVVVRETGQPAIFDGQQMTAENALRLRVELLEKLKMSKAEAMKTYAIRHKQ